LASSEGIDVAWNGRWSGIPSRRGPDHIIRGSAAVLDAISVSGMAIDDRWHFVTF
jgi:hypothetical protein